MELLVKKYGGTSVGSPEQIQNIAASIQKEVSLGKKLVIVVSAMGNSTDELVRLAHSVSKKSTQHQREMDMLLSAGERISMALLSMALQDQSVSAVSFTGSQTGIITSSHHRNAKIMKILGDRVRTSLDAGKVVIVAGFQGVSSEKEITTLGRGGSDTTAVALASVLEADRCEICTDVDGVFSGPPQWIEKPRLHRKISYGLMQSMASAGAKVIHPRAVALAKKFGVELLVTRSHCSSESAEQLGTLVVSKDKVGKEMENLKVVGVTADTQKMLMKVALMRPTVAGAIWNLAKDSHLSLHLPFFVDGEVWFFVDRDEQEKWESGLRRLTEDGFISSYSGFADMVPVTVTGEGISEDGELLQKVCDVAASQKVSVTTGSASGSSFTIAVPDNLVQATVDALHRDLIGSDS